MVKIDGFASAPHGLGTRLVGVIIHEKTFDHMGAELDWLQSVLDIPDDRPFPNPIKEDQVKIFKLEKEVERLKKDVIMWHDAYQNLLNESGKK